MTVNIQYIDMKNFQCNQTDRLDAKIKYFYNVAICLSST